MKSAVATVLVVACLGTISNPSLAAEEELEHAEAVGCNVILMQALLNALEQAGLFPGRLATFSFIAFSHFVISI